MNMTENKQKTIYVLVHQLSEACEPHEEWQVVSWNEHPALAPHPGGKQMVSTAAGDVELRVPPVADHKYNILGWAAQHIEQLHPHPAPLSLEGMSNEALLETVLQLSLEYVALAEDGRGHSARSRYLACQLRDIQEYTTQQLTSNVI